MAKKIRRVPLGVAFGLSAATVAALLTGCGQPAASSQGGDSAQTEKTVEGSGYTLTDGQVNVDGKTLTVSLDVDHDGGHEWEEKLEGDGLKFDGVEHDTADSTDVFTFTGESEGTQSITFTCTDADGKEDKTVTMETATDASGTIVSTNATGSDGSSGSTMG